MADDIQLALVTQLPEDSWYEGIVVRPNGLILAARLDEPQLYTFDPADATATPELIHTFPDCNGLVNICVINGGEEEEYAVITGRYDLKTVDVDPGSWVIWRVVMHGASITVSKIADLPESGLLIDLASAAPLSPDTLLIADSAKSSVLRLNMRTGDCSVLVTDDTMKAVQADDFFGINTLRMTRGYVWYTNTSAGLLCRVPVGADPDAGIRTTGPVEIITAALSHCDGLAIRDDERTAFTAGYMAGVVWRVDMDDKGTGTPAVLTKMTNSPTSVELVEGGDGKAKLFVVVCGQTGTVGWVNEDESDEEEGNADAGLSGFGKLEISVTVIEEVKDKV